MTELLLTRPSLALRRMDKALLAGLLIIAVLTIVEPGQVFPIIGFALRALAHTAPFILFAVASVAYLKATGAETLLSKAFSGHMVRMILMGALLGGLSPFCSCEVIPFIAALLAMGVPLAGVMAFWLSSPLMDPAMFTITANELGWDFAVAKTVAAIGIGVFGGAVVWGLSRSAMLTDILRDNASPGCGCGTQKPFSGKPVWQFWRYRDRSILFRETALSQTIFLGKWLALAYLLEALMVTYVPADWIANMLGGDGVGPIILGALVGGPAYLNGYVAASLLGGLVDQGMSSGAAMSFMIAGGVSCIPAAVAVAALVKARVLVLYLALGGLGAILAGLGWAAIA